MAVVSDDAPVSYAVFEVIGGDEFGVGSGGGFDDADVIKKDFAGIEEAEDEFFPLAVWTDGACAGGGLEGVVLPGGL